jgi:hypothetical protein
VVVLLFTSCVLTEARRSPETDLAAPGAPLYEQALNESVKSLMSKQEKEALGEQGRPPSPGPDYYWCENCKAYHRKQAPAAAQRQTGEQQVRTPQQQAAAPARKEAARPPSPGPEYYWCENCNQYHKKKPQDAVSPDMHPDTAQEAAGSPGSDYYWCDKCKTYHRRKSPAQQPLHLHPGPGGQTNRLFAPAPQDMKR